MAGEEAVGPLSRGEVLDVAGDVGVEEAVAVGAEDLQPPHPGTVGEAATIAHAAVSLRRRGDCRSRGAHGSSLHSRVMISAVPFTLQAPSAPLHGLADLPDEP